MHARVERAHKFRRYDRIVIQGAHYRPLEKIRDTHVFQLVADGVLEQLTITKTDAQINALSKRGAFLCEKDYYSDVMAKLRVRNDDTDLGSLSDDALKTIAWKREWCVRFIRAASDPRDPRRPRWTLPGMRKFIANELASMEEWYVREFDERRPLGRRRKDHDRKHCDYPGASTLRDWLFAYRKSGHKLEAFVSRYDLCGNRHQLAPEVANVVSDGVAHWLSLLPPTVSDVKDFVDVKLREIAAKERLESAPTVSEKAIRKRIKAVDVFKRDAARLGVKAAYRRHAPVGRGLVVVEPLQRVEMDDWEFDLSVLLVRSSAWSGMSDRERRAVSRVRCTATVAIDVATRCIVGFNLSPSAPSTPAAKSALRSIFIDKSAYAAAAGAKSPWHMYGNPQQLVTDGGPVFKGDFSASQEQLVGRLEPTVDPRQRGTIESFFRTFKRLCRWFAGRTFSNVVEKGEYNPEEMASVTYEELHRLAVRFIVDDYHNRPHRGLERQTPASAWRNLTARRGGHDPLPSTGKLIQAFGMKGTAKLQKDGIAYFCGSYQSAPLARLYRMVGNRKVDLVVDPDDLNSILVRIPKTHVDRDDLVDSMKEAGQKDGHYLVVPATGGRAPHTRLVDLVYASRYLRTFVAEENKAGREIRLDLYADLLDRSERARVAAGLPPHVLTQDAYDRLVRAAERAATFALNEPEKVVDGGGKPLTKRGIVVASNRKNAGSDDGHAGLPGGEAPTVPHGPFDGGVNMFGEDGDD